MSNKSQMPFDILMESDEGLYIERMSAKEYHNWEPKNGEKIVVAPINPHVNIRFKKDSSISNEHPVLVPGGSDEYKTLRKQGYTKVAGFNINENALVKYVNGKWIFAPGVHPDSERVNLINATVEQFDDGSLTNFITDGSHTFGELYHHRAVLTALFAKQVRTWERGFDAAVKSGWIDQEKHDTLTQLCGVVRSKKHADGTMFDGYFVVLFTTPTGDYSYHYPITEWDLFDGIRTVEKTGEYDGHKPEDIDRLLNLYDFMNQKMEGEEDEKTEA